MAGGRAIDRKKTGYRRPVWRPGRTRGTLSTIVYLISLIEKYARVFFGHSFSEKMRRRRRRPRVRRWNQIQMASTLAQQLLL